MDDDDRRREDWAAEVKDRLKAALKAKGLDWRDASVAAGLAEGTLGSRLAERSLMKDWWGLVRLAEVVGMTPDQILCLRPAPADVAAKRDLRREQRLVERDRKIQAQSVEIRAELRRVRR